MYIHSHLSVAGALNHSTQNSGSHDSLRYDWHAVRPAPTNETAAKECHTPQYASLEIAQGHTTTLLT